MRTKHAASLFMLSSGTSSASPIAAKFLQHRSKIAISSLFCGFYAGTCYSALTWQSEVMRMGVAGSLATLICDSCFHVVDTVNIRAKAAVDPLCTSTNPQ